MNNKGKKNNKLLFFKSYFKNLKLTIDNIDLDKLSLITTLLEKKIVNNNTIFVAGNGGSSSIANHTLCDFNKGIKISSKKKLKPKFISLSNSIETITAISNDINDDTNENTNVPNTETPNENIPDFSNMDFNNLMNNDTIKKMMSDPNMADKMAGLMANLKNT